MNLGVGANSKIHKSNRLSHIEKLHLLVEFKQLYLENKKLLQIQKQGKKIRWFFS